MASKLLRISKNFTNVLQRCKSSTAAEYQTALSSLPPTELSITNNKLKVASQELDSDTTTVGLWISAGARHEEGHNNGAGRLIERLVCSGADLQEEVANIGGRVYSFTSREKTAFYGTVLNKDVPKLVEILSNAVTNPKASDADLANVRKEILREADEVEANVRDVVFDLLHSTAYQATALGKSVLGPRENIENLSVSDLKNYISTYYKGSSIVLAGAGGAKHSELTNLAEKHLGKLDYTFDGEAPALSKCRYTGSEVRLRDDSLPYAHFAIAVEGPGSNSPDRIPLLIARTALGSYDRSEGKLGPEEICHSYKAFNIEYSDTGLFGVYAVTDPMQCDDFARSALDAFHRVGESITDAEINEAKNRLITKLLTQIDGSKGVCEDIGNSISSYGRRIPLNELEAAIANTPSQTIRDVTQKYFNNKCPAVSAVGPIENLTDYVGIRTRMYWARV